MTSGLIVWIYTDKWGKNYLNLRREKSLILFDVDFAKVV